MGRNSTITFGRWLIQTGNLDHAELGELSKQYADVERRARMQQARNFSLGPMTFTAFIAAKYPTKFVVYQTYLRLIGADTIKISKD